MIDVIAAQLGLLSRQVAEIRALETLNSIHSNWPRDGRGWFVHWTHRNFQPEGEYSTIDTSIMVAGAYFAGNYFGGQAKVLANAIGRTPKWQTIIVNKWSANMYRVSKPSGMDGAGAGYNEYYITAYLAQLHEPKWQTLTKDYFRDMFAYNGKPKGRGWHPK